MPKISPAGLCRRQPRLQVHRTRPSRTDLPALAQSPIRDLPPHSARFLSSSAASSFPRAGPHGRQAQASDADKLPEEELDDAVEDAELYEPSSTEGGGPSSTADPEALREIVISVASPPLSKEPPSEEGGDLHRQLLTAFHPANQPLEPTSSPVGQDGISPMTLHRWPIPGSSEQSAANPAGQEPTLALVSPFDGGRQYIQHAVNEIAGVIGADVLRFDLALGLGLDGSSSPLGRSGHACPGLPNHLNPLLQDIGKVNQSLENSYPIASPPILDEEGDEAEEDTDHRGPGAIVVTPFLARHGFGHEGGEFPNQLSPVGSFRDDWVAFFSHWINLCAATQARPTRSKRIILLESAEAMSATFSEWWPSLVEAVRRRRLTRPTQGPQLGLADAKPEEVARPQLFQPTVIVLASTSSPLLCHTSPVRQLGQADPNGAAESLHPVLQEIADRFGGTLETKVETQNSNPLWWSNEEIDTVGREDRTRVRLATLLEHSKGPSSLLPAFGTKSSRALGRSPRLPFLNMFSQQGPNQHEGSLKSDFLVWQTLPILPSKRDQLAEMLERTQYRSIINSLLLDRALHELGGRLVNPLAAMNLIEVEITRRKHHGPRIMRLEPGEASSARLQKLLDGRFYRVAPDGWQNRIKSVRALKRLASSAIGRSLANSSGESSDLVDLTWLDVSRASLSDTVALGHLESKIRRVMPKRSQASATSTTLLSKPESPTDSVVVKVKKAKDLSPHEKRLLGSIVDTSKLTATTFQSVHLPFKTIDAIRTIISLPLLFPDAFRGGVLKDHSTSGALLFGPPGTGKTLLARAVANESGARMLAIQPSDVNDKYFGEGEKLVKAVFSLARRLSPCVVFLDEVDALFGARSSRGSGHGNKAHDQLLTEFMQEMDGLSSAEVNKDKRVVVIGATNRPFDLDDAVLRRLPRRLLVDLPGAEDRKAILGILLQNERLAADVDLDRICRETDGFSGSDLKHLCVSAALAAVKDAVQVPWSDTSHSSHKASSQAVIGQSSPSRPPASRCVNVLGEEEGARLQEEILHAPLAAANSGPPTLAPELGTSVVAQEANADASRIEDLRVADQTHRESQTELSGDSSNTAPSCAHDERLANAPDHQGASAFESVSPARTLTQRHFDVALGEIRPSSSEEGSLPELRKWAEQFGEGGTKKPRKKGFGRGFGFNDPTLAVNRDRGYGKVDQAD